MRERFELLAVGKLVQGKSCETGGSERVTTFVTIMYFALSLFAIFMASEGVLA